MLIKKELCFLLLIISAVLTVPASAWSKLNNSIDINCQQTKEFLKCDYRTPQGEKLNSFKATANGEPLPLEQQSYAIDKSNPPAVLFVVDTSDPARQNVIEKNKQQIRALVSAIPSQFRVGLASFDKTLRIESPLGESAFLLKKKLDGLNAVGKTTELYRNIIKALDYLDAQQGARKALILMSDGQAEDKAYFHADVIRVARKAGIIINSIGYPRSVSLSVALQTIRRLSEETGGIYTEASINYELPEDYINTAFDNITSGGSLSISLGGVADKTKVNNIRLEYSGQQGKRGLSIPVKFADSGVVPVRPSVGATPAQTELPTTPEQAAPVRIITRQVETQPINLWLWYGIPAAFIIIIILILITLFLLWQRQPSRKTQSSTYEYRPYAYLINETENNKRYPITRTIWRIGRGKDNELALDDSSISRRHAEIHRNINGAFDIVDMNSMNGVYINNEKIGKAVLQEGDLIEIGDIFLKFTQFAPDYSDEESTVMQKTKTPAIS